MATDYVLFIHGVNIRNQNYADELFQRLEKSASDRQRNFQKIALYWYEANKIAEYFLLKQL